MDGFGPFPRACHPEGPFPPPRYYGFIPLFEIALFVARLLPEQYTTQAPSPPRLMEPGLAMGALSLAAHDQCCALSWPGVPQLPPATPTSGPSHCIPSPPAAPWPSPVPCPRQFGCLTDLILLLSFMVCENKLVGEYREVLQQPCLPPLTPWRAPSLGPPIAMHCTPDQHSTVLSESPCCRR